jgi:2'-5' RNA ligase
VQPARQPRPFRPHVTVGRARRGARRPPLPAAPPAVGFALTALVLWASRGGRYEALQRAEIAL